MDAGVWMAAAGDRQARETWVLRVLGVDVSGRSDVAAALLARLQHSVAEIRHLPQDDVAKQLTAKAAKIGAEMKSHHPAAAASLIDVLETEIAAASRAARNAEAVVEAGSHVAYGKLRLRWVRAKSTTLSRLDTFCSKMLQDPEVQQDPRFPQVQEILPTLTDAIPSFGSALQDALDALEKLSAAPVPADRAMALSDALAALESYRRTLDAATEFAELSDFAQGEYGTDLAGDLVAALSELEAGLTAGG